MVYKLQKKKLNKFLKGLVPELYAPIKTDAIRFQQIKDPKDIHLDKNADFPVKEFFFKNREELFKYKDNKVWTEIDDAPRRIFFGLRRCDLNAVKHQDFVFMEKHKDPYYTANRKNSILVGYHCNVAPSKYCFCGSMDLVEYHDLMFFDREDHFIVEVGSDKGKALLTKDFKKIDQEITQDDRKIDFTNRLKNKNIEKLYDNPGWKEGVNKCISCAACTTLCPTCYCHEIKDEVKLSDLKEGNRLRVWSSCQLKSFTRVAGDHVFRDDREERFKHRIYHQLQYFKERYNVEMCVGCGRCISHCPTEIDFVEIINKMEK